MNDLFSDIPASVRLKDALPLPPPLSEPALLDELRRLAERNNRSLFTGGGVYEYFIPSAVKHLIGRAEFYTAYTPYQAEASQGTLQAIYEYQSLVCALTGMEVANASLYDGATALAEAAFMAVRLTGRKEVAVSAAANPFYREILRTYCRAADLFLREIPYDLKAGVTLPVERLQQSACFILQQPNFFGCLEPVSSLAEKIHAAGALFVVSASPHSLGLLKGPGEYGADIVVAEGQEAGNPRNFGGPGLGIFATRKAFVRQMPGRVVGATTDLEGKRGFVLTLSTREQHIRRERATSNICSNEALCALASAIYLSLLGKNGLKKAATLSLQNTGYFRRSIPASRLLFSGTQTFNELVVKTDQPVGLALAPYYPELGSARLLTFSGLASRKELDLLVGKLP
ncbi:MAG: aminomethyl-transferring glycine dehydrogenase subunit GcvPA [Candidatus Margulisbacteria bacterium]|nr:aminomethyl-transferring glycine dehydrogenase subunit GcvPA [Candidatus Margulisiibacteriota bacterium]MBU1616687.1 aminomethyl-transferring glycine dehydrogenase subunit GcvPA [Candidatus Margulisiibacteriota bacterium]MBU1867134.1 aminomethyl-transferring glycine dehydrogenase subunit GcvPA [Candidatus Margulisiibacteriota bacterium]